MRKTDRATIIAVSCILTGQLFVAGCAEERKATPDLPRPSKGIDEAADPGISGEDQLERARQKQDAIARKLGSAQDEVRRLTTDLAVARQETRERSEELAQARGKLAALARRLETSEATTREISAQLQESRAENNQTQSLLEEWVAYAQELESREKAYDAYIESQNQVIQKLAVQQQVPVPAQEIAPRIPDRLVPGKNGAVSRAQFFSIVRGMTLAELRTYIGAPDSVKGNPPEEYIYRRALTYAFDINRPDSSVRVVVEEGTVKRCLYSE